MNKLSRRDFLKAGIGITSAILLSSCDKDERPSYKGTPDDAISEVSTPRQAQDFINKYIDYKNRSSSVRGVNGGNTYSLSRLLEKHSGLCRDGAVAAAVMLKDDGYPSLILNRAPKNKQGHVVFVYQDSNRNMDPDSPNWGSVGINSYDFREPKFTLDQIVSGIDHKFRYQNDGFYSLHDLSLFDLKTGPDGWVNENLCMVFRRNLGVVSPDGYGSFSMPAPDIVKSKCVWVDNGMIIDETSSYDLNQFGKTLAVTIDDNNSNIDREYTVLITGRFPNGSRKTARTLNRFFKNNSLDSYQEIFSEFYENSDKTTMLDFDGYRLTTINEYYPNGALQTITQHEVLPDGRKILRFDFNADGVWDYVQGP